MAINENVLKKWREVQSQYSHPVDSFGSEIKPKETDKYKMWEDLGLYAYMKEEPAE